MACSLRFLRAFAVLAVVAGAAMAQEAPSRDLDDITYEGVIDRSTPIEAEKMLQIWANRLGTLIVVDPSVAPVKLKFLQSDVTLTWGLFKRLLEFHDVVLEEREVKGRWITYATRRGGLLPKGTVSSPIIGPEGALPRREEVVTAILQVTHGSAPDIFANLRQIQAVRDQNHTGNMLYVRGPEVILVVDFASNVDYYTRLVRAMDVRAPGQVTRVFSVTYAPVEDVVRVIAGLLHGPGAPGQPPGFGPLAPNIIPDVRANKLFVQCYADQLEDIKWMIGELDVKALEKPTTRHFYACEHADAVYLAGKLSEVFAGGAASPSRRKGKAAPPPVAPSAPAAPAAAKDVTAIDTRIVADERSNALIITADETVYLEILDALRGGPGHPGLDRAARRVLVEAQVFENSTPTDNVTIGFELAGLQNPKHGELRPAGATSFGLSTTSLDPTTNRIVRTPNLGSGLMGVVTQGGFDRLPLILQAVASLEKTRLVTTPFAVTNDNEEVKFSSGVSIAYPKNAYGAVGGGVGLTTIEYANATTDLTVRPQVHSDQSLTLEVNVQLKSIAGTGGPGLPPTLDTRSYEGTVTVPNMSYVIFGGLESETSTVSEDKMPYLGDVPILGHLFKHQQRTRSRAKIYIFIRPVILADDDRGFVRLSTRLREHAQVEAEREEWLPPIAPEWVMKTPEKTLQDRVFEVFGTGSGCPFSTQPSKD